MLSFRSLKDKILQWALRLGEDAIKNPIRLGNEFGMSIEDRQKLIQQADRLLHGKSKEDKKKKAT